MTALVGTVFLASLVGSLHCAGMCGPFVVLSQGAGRQSPAAHLAIQLAYNGGRLITYTALGVLAGWLGAALNLGGAWLGVQRAALVLAGAAMIVFGLLTLLRMWGLRLGTPGAPMAMGRLFRRGYAAAQNRPRTLRALIVGLLSTFLPCGWLYAFVIAAASTGTAGLGALTMAAFWLGTLPVMVSLGAGVRGLAGPLRRHVPALSAIALILVGLVAVLGRLQVPALVAAERLPSSEAPGIEQAIDRVDRLEADGPHCSGDTE